LFLGKSTKTAATRAALFDSNMHQYAAPKTPYLYLGGLLLKGGEMMGEEGERRRGEGREGVRSLP